MFRDRAKKFEAVAKVCVESVKEADSYTKYKEQIESKFEDITARCNTLVNDLNKDDGYQFFKK